jgi:uncharacterized membrane-anchored protein
MPRKRRRRPEARPQARPEATGSAPSAWQWRTFPVFLAFAVGLLFGTQAAIFPPVYFVVSIVALFAVVFGLTHMATRWFVQRRQQAKSEELTGPGRS